MKIDFEFTHEKYGTFRDSLLLPDDHETPEDQLEQLKRQRFEAWVFHIENAASVTIEPDQKIEGVINIDGDEWFLLTTVPPARAKLIEFNGNWYYKPASE